MNSFFDINFLSILLTQELLDVFTHIEIPDDGQRYGTRFAYITRDTTNRISYPILGKTLKFTLLHFLTSAGIVTLGIWTTFLYY